MNKLAAVIAFTIAATALSHSGDVSAQTSTSAVRINSKTYSVASLRRMGIKGHVRPGNYWYDRRSGAWGYVGTGAMGATAPNLPFGAMRLPRTNTNIWINGREIVLREAKFLYWLFGRVAPGRYFLNANGDAGLVGGPARVNLIRSYQQRIKRQGKRGFYRNGLFSSGGCAAGYCSFRSKVGGKHLSWPN